MRLETLEGWAKADKTSTTLRRDDGEDWYGLAIGPASDEALVDIDGFRLQSGRVYPARARTYTLNRIRPRAGGIALQNLQVALLEHPGELAADFARPDSTYSSAPHIINNQIGVFAVPFEGRRELKVSIATLPTAGNVQPTFTYTVFGIDFSYASNLVSASPFPFKVPLKTETPTMFRPSATTYSGGLLPATGPFYTYAFYVGGVDNAEKWAAIGIEITNNSGEDHDWFIDMYTIGEMGAR